MMTKKEFKNLVTINANGCWIWNGSRRGGDYGQCSHKLDRSRLAHRLAFKLFKDQALPNEIKVLHKCDVQACSNPEHLFSGTCKDNSMDAARKGKFKHLPGRKYNTVKARRVLASRYKNAAWRAEQGKKIAEGWAKRKRKLSGLE